MRRHITSVVLALSVAGVAVAQTPTVENAAPVLRSCTYDSCALRLSHRIFRGLQVQQGLDGPRTKFGFTGGGVVRAVQAVPAAAAVADSARRQFRKGAIISLVSGVAGGLLYSAALNADVRSRTRDRLFAGTLVTASFSVLGGVQLTRGMEKYSRALWLYNREIPR